MDKRVSKLCSADRSLIRMIVDKCHVSFSDDEVMSYLHDRLRVICITPQCHKQVRRVALARHHSNINTNGYTPTGVLRCQNA